jgi:hypothetical protein
MAGMGIVNQNPSVLVCGASDNRGASQLGNHPKPVGGIGALWQACALSFETKAVEYWD